MNANLFSAIQRLANPKVEAALLILACVSWPFYVLPSGQPQIFVVFLLAFCLMVFVSKPDLLSIIRETRLVSIAFGVFLAYTIIVNGYYALKYDSIRPIVYSAYFALSFAVAVFLSVSVTRNTRILEALYYGIAASLLLQGALLLVNIGDSCARQVMYFNNPNQLAFYSLVCLSFLVFLNPVLGKGKSLLIAASTVALILILVTHSRAAFICAVLLILIQMLSASKPVKLAIATSVLMILTLGVILDAADLEEDMCKTRKNLLTSLQDVSSMSELFTPIGDESSLSDLLKKDPRFSRLPSGSYTLEARLQIRGYDRIWKYPEYLVFGSGEGLMREYSFNGKKLIEFHSSVGTLVFSYGVAGTLFTLYLIAILVSRGGVRAVLLILPLAVYSLSHNTLRQPFLWMFLVLIINMAYIRMSPEQKLKAVDSGDKSETSTNGNRPE